MTRQLTSQLSGRRIAEIVAAILLPPLGVFLNRGLGSEFWISVVLTILAFVPGMIYALYLILIDSRTRAAA